MTKYSMLIASTLVLCSQSLSAETIGGKYYRESASGTCDGSVCGVLFAAVPNKKILIVTSVSCVSLPTSEIRSANVFAKVGQKLKQVGIITSQGEPAVLTAPFTQLPFDAGERIQIYLTSQPPTVPTCLITGVFENK